MRGAAPAQAVTVHTFDAQVNVVFWHSLGAPASQDREQGPEPQLTSAFLQAWLPLHCTRHLLASPQLIVAPSQALSARHSTLHT